MQDKRGILGIKNSGGPDKANYFIRSVMIVGNYTKRLHCNSFKTECFAEINLLCLNSSSDRLGVFICREPEIYRNKYLIYEIRRRKEKTLT